MNIVILLAFLLSPPTLPAPTGNHTVGVKNLVFERPTETGETRQLNAWIFFPATKSSNQSPRKYLSDPRLLAAMKEEKYLRFTSDSLDQWTKISTHAFEDATPLNEKFPVVFILHGRGSSKVNYTLLAEEICSHGYVVVLSDHPGSGLTILKDGTKAALASPADLTKEVNNFSGDVCFLVNELPKNNAVSRIADMSNMAMVGHSLGSMAVFNTGLNNCGFRAAVNFDGPPFGEAVNKGMSIPHLTIWGELPTHLSVSVDTLNARRIRLWRSFLALSNKDHILLKAKGMYHNDFNDQIFLSRGRLASRYPGAINAERGYRITYDVTVAYLNHQLKQARKEDLLRKIESIPEFSSPRF